MRWRSDGGFTLVEVLVALFVLAIGIAGATATQMAALRTQRQSALTSGAVQLAASLAERMHANPVAMAASDNPYLHLDYDAAGGAPAQPVACFGPADCDPVQMAQFDSYEAAFALHAGFPHGRIVVCRDAAAVVAWPCQPGAGAPVVVKIGWRLGEDAGDAPLLAMVVPQ